MRATDIMTRPVITVTPDASIKEAARLLLRHGITAAPVVDGTDQLVGIVSEIDLLTGDVPADPLAHAIPIPPDLTPPPTAVRDVMTSSVVALSEDADAAEFAKVMRETGVKSVPVQRGGRVVGIVSRKDLLRAVARDDEQIRADVLARIVEYVDKRAAWDVEVCDGVVTVRVVDADAISAKAASLLARSVPGALRVHLVVESASSTVPD